MVTVSTTNDAIRSAVGFYEDTELGYLRIYQCRKNGNNIGFELVHTARTNSGRILSA